MTFVLELSKAGEVSEFGGKAVNLGKLIRAGLPVPTGFAVGLGAFEKGGELNKDAIEKLQSMINQSKLYAVRSSATAEDAEGASWAGQFESFLNTRPVDVTAMVEKCHQSAKARAKAYADMQEQVDNFRVAVVVQEMLEPEYAGVLFTRDPVTGEDKLITEYVEGLGEDLVSGKSDPRQVVLGSGDKLPFDDRQLSRLATATEKLFGVPQDIEWAWADNTMWLVQARPITTEGTNKHDTYLGEPSELFYWGPSRAKPFYMSDFMAAVEKFFTSMAADSALPSPPKSLVLFEQGRMVWLSNAEEFSNFTEATFEAYEKRNQLDNDMAQWQKSVDQLAELKGQAFAEELIKAWVYTEFAEFSLYGAESALIKRLDRFNADERQEIWRTYTIPDRPTFLNRIDEDLSVSRDVRSLATKYPWIQDGYDGVVDDAESYFEKRLSVVGDTITDSADNAKKREGLANKLSLSDEEVGALTLARRLAEFMDDRKAWMMQTRRILRSPVHEVQNGWLFDGARAILIDQEGTAQLWQRYVDFRVSTNVVQGIVASNGNKHFVNGEVVVVSSPTDSVPDGRILVVPSTSPSYVPLMRKAKALITDHGGMMSHAAIVAREFGLPCIVGTKQATKVLKTGDKISVDLVNGKVIG